MNTRERIEALLHRWLQSGRFQRFPKNPDHLDIVLAVAASRLERRRPYAEGEVNEALTDWLDSVYADVDHVTLRRRMVDCGFLKRTTNGSRYFVNYGRVAAVLGDPAIEVDAGAIADNVMRIRDARKRAYFRLSQATRRNDQLPTPHANPTLEGVKDLQGSTSCGLERCFVIPARD